MIMLIDDYRLIMNTLKCCIDAEYWDLFDWQEIINRAEEVDENIYCFDCHFLKVYFNEKMEPVEYKNQKIINGAVYQDLNENKNGAGTYTHIMNIP